MKLIQGYSVVRVLLPNLLFLGFGLNLCFKMNMIRILGVVVLFFMTIIVMSFYGFSDSFTGLGRLPTATDSEYLHLQVQKKKFYSNPIIRQTGDPHAMKFEDRYYIYLPGNKKVDGVSVGNYKVFESSNLVDWVERGFLFNNVKFRGKQLWAPDVYYHPEDQQFYLYYTLVHDKATSVDPRVGHKDIGVAVSSSPTGPFEAVHRDGSDVILLGSESDYAFIDPNLFRDNDGSLHLIYKYRGEFGTGSSIYRQKLESPIATTGTQKMMMSNYRPSGWIGSHPNNRFTWEVLNGSRTLEQPYMARAHGFYYLFYSANQGETENYGIGVLRSISLDDLFVKHPDYVDEPLIGKRMGQGVENSIIGPGAVSIVQDAYQRSWLVYRQKNNFDFNWQRSVCLDRIEFMESGQISVRPTKNEQVLAPLTTREL